MTKIIFGARALGVPTPLLVKAVLKWIKRVCMFASTLTVVSEHQYVALAFMAVAWLSDEIEPLFGSEIIENGNLD